MKIPNIETLEEVIRVKLGRTLNIKITENLYFRIMGIDMIIPKGFISDGASIPRALRWAINELDSRWLFAAIVHDYIYRTQFMPRIVADNVFKLILSETAGPSAEFFFYKGVRVGGWLAWNENRKKLEKHPEAKHSLMKYICNQANNDKNNNNI